MITWRSTAGRPYRVSKPVKTVTAKTGWKFNASLLPGKNNTTLDSVANKGPGKILNVICN